MPRAAQPLFSPPSASTIARSWLWWAFMASVLLCAVGLYYLWASHIVWPLRALIVTSRELGHAAGLLGSGGELDLKVSMVRGGQVLGNNGSAFIVAHGGLLGPAAVGAMLLLLARSAAGTRLAIRTIGVVILFSSLWVTRPLVSVSFAYPLFVSCVLFAAGGWLKEGALPPAAFCVRIVAALCLFAVVWDDDSSHTQGSPLVGGVHPPALGKKLAKMCDASRLEALTWVSAKIFRFGFGGLALFTVAVLHPTPPQQDAAPGFPLPDFV
eukprot:TRINITY_DN20194_c0_g1_i1.p1 TRINITY_DN20194_c0_g1~~TRINITY_DN20194_c0_g1_i1.p1  ORF type:complete len:296 (+),score=76.69 TRINITY_DN20194_c0_g1_i1:87-890(+)